MAALPLLAEHVVSQSKKESERSKRRLYHSAKAVHHMSASVSLFLFLPLAEFMQV